MEHQIYVVDDFLDNPDVVRNSALQIDFKTTGTFPGVRSDAADLSYQEMIGDKLDRIFGNMLEYGPVQFRKNMDCFSFQLCLENEKTWIHKDKSQWAGVLYLTPNAPIDSGTGIFDKHENLITMVGNVYNRMVLYRGDLLHRSIVPGFGDTPETGRLTQVFFFDHDEVI